LFPSKLLSAFRLPGEAQQIDRVMKAFASHYFNQQTKEECVFTDSDAVYVFAFSAIMLHTDAHNKNVKNKMTKSQFIKNNEGVNGGQDLPKKFQEDIYTRIVDNGIFIYLFIYLFSIFSILFIYLSLLRNNIKRTRGGCRMAQCHQARQIGNFGKW